VAEGETMCRQLPFLALHRVTSVNGGKGGSVPLWVERAAPKPARLRTDHRLGGGCRELTSCRLPGVRLPSRAPRAAKMVLKCGPTKRARRAAPPPRPPPPLPRPPATPLPDGLIAPPRRARTEVCRFSGLRVYPGHGTKMARVDGQVFLFLSAKCKRLYNNRLKPSKLAWTALYRKAHKKARPGRRSHRRRSARADTPRGQDQSTETARKKRKTTKTAQTRSIVGASLEARPPARWHAGASLPRCRP